MKNALGLAVGLVLVAGLVGHPVWAQRKLPSSMLQKVRDGVFRLGTIEIDTLKKELRVPGVANSNVTVLEFVANTKGGMKAYESALTLDCDAVMLNTALLLIGMDPARSRVPKQHFDPVPPKGDPLEIWVEWTNRLPPATARRVRIEQLLYDERTHTTLSEGPWVYTGSTFMDNRYMADIDGVLIGFVHSPAPVIENPRKGAVSAYGSIVMNTHIGLDGGTPVVVSIKSLTPAKGAK
jgi:hypothetical protein